jgi:predicted aldo/keto reductase-like oxidoreductase
VVEGVMCAKEALQIIKDKMASMRKLGFGLMRMPIINKNDETSFNYNMINKMVDDFIANGFNYFDNINTFCRQFLSNIE